MYFSYFISDRTYMKCIESHLKFDLHPSLRKCVFLIRQGTRSERMLWNHISDQRGNVCNFLQSFPFRS